MKYQQQTQMGGAWAKTSELTNGSKAKIVSEAKSSPSSFLDKNGNAKTQDVAKVQFGEGEALNVSLNRTTINGLVNAFGEDSVNWQNKPLTVETEKMRVAGKAVTALYLIPQGYNRVDDENGYAVIIKEGDSLPQREQENSVEGNTGDPNAEFQAASRVNKGI